MSEAYDCPFCDEDHTVTEDEDGYELAFCPKKGTTLVSRPGENR